MSENYNRPCPSEDGFPGDAHIALACDRCPQLIIACQKYGHAGLASGDLTDEVARIAELEDSLGAMTETFQLAMKQRNEAEATIERLKCCGNCQRWGLLGFELTSASICRHMLTDASDNCHFTPSRWTEGGTPSQT